MSDFQNTQTRVNFPVRGFSLKYNAAATDHTTRLRHIAEWVIERLAKKNLLTGYNQGPISSGLILQNVVDIPSSRKALCSLLEQFNSVL